MGKYVRGYQRRGGMTWPQKAGAIGMMVAMVALSTFAFIPEGSAARIIVPVAGLVGALTVAFAVPNATTYSNTHKNTTSQLSGSAYGADVMGGWRQGY